MAIDRRCIVCDGSGPFRTTFVDPGGHRLVRCPTCGLMFQDPQPCDAVLERSYYQDPAFAAALFGPLREITLSRAREKVSLLESAGAIRPGMRTLDVGCSSGAWMEVAESHGLAATGVEVGAAVAQLARRRGLDVRTGSLEHAFPALADERFDLVTFWDVLEHLRDPRHDLALAARLLAPGGLLAATFPNAEGLYPTLTYRLLARTAGVWEYPELPVHLYDFAPRTARALLGRVGYQTLAMRTLATPFRFYRATSLSPERLGGGPRGVLLRAGFEALRMAAYPLARLSDRGNSLFLTAELVGRQPPATAGRMVTSSPSSTDVSRPSRKRMSSPPT